MMPALRGAMTAAVAVYGVGAVATSGVVSIGRGGRVVCETATTVAVRGRPAWCGACVRACVRAHRTHTRVWGGYRFIRSGDASFFHNGWNVCTMVGRMCFRCVVCIRGCMMVGRLFPRPKAARPEAVQGRDISAQAGSAPGTEPGTERQRLADGLVGPLLLVSVRDVGALVETRVVGLPRVAWVSGAAGSGAPHRSTGATW